MSTVRVTWIDSVSAGVLGNKVLRDEIEIADIGMGVQTYDDATALSGTTYKYTVQAYDASSQTTIEVPGVNTDTIATTITNFVFPGGALDYMIDNAGVPTMLDGIVQQTWIVMIKMTQMDWQHGILGVVNGGGNLKLEVDASDNRADGQLLDNGNSSFINADTSIDMQWHQMAMRYNGADMAFWFDGVSTQNTADPDFIGRVDGRVTIFGGAVLTGVDGHLIGELSDVQFYNRALTDPELVSLAADITNLPADNATSLVANFAGNKTANGSLAGQWISEVGGFVMVNNGNVTYN